MNTGETRMEIRSFQIRSVDTETGTIEGVAAPFDEVFDAGDFKERFAPGVFDDFESDSSIPLYAEHDHLVRGLPIGTIFEGSNTDAGFVIKANFNSTTKAADVRSLVNDGSLKSFSVGFNPVEGDYDDDTNTITHTRAELMEVSVVAFPAYKTAGITAVRSELAVRNDSDNTNERSHIDNTMTDNIEYATAADIAEVRDAVDALNRGLADIKFGNDDNSADAPLFRSAGAFVKAHANGDDKAVALYRAYTGATSDDAHKGIGWLDSTLKVIDKGRPVVNLFTRAALPAGGLTVTYPYTSGITGDVASQANEGDNLATLAVTVDTRNAPVKTYGVHSELSRQAIERVDVSYLDAVLRAQAASYAKVTNAKVRSTLAGASAQAGTSFTLSSATAGDFLGAVIDGVAKIDANGEGAQAEFIVVSSDVWAKAVGTSSTGFAFDLRGDAGRTIGSANVPAIAGSLVGLPVVVDGGLAAKSFYVASSEAITVWENAGAPIRLDDENVVNLTKVYSIYGYMADAVTNANALVKATIA